MKILFESPNLHFLMNFPQWISKSKCSINVNMALIKVVILEQSIVWIPIRVQWTRLKFCMQGRRNQGGRGQRGNWSIYPIQTREVDYAHQIHTRPSRFSDLPTALAFKNISFIQKLTKGQRGDINFLKICDFLKKIKM